MSMFTHCFPHASSFSDLHASDSEYEGRDDLFDFNTFTRTTHSDASFMNGASRKLGHYLLMSMWRFVLKSPMLFRIREEYDSDVKLLERFCCKRIDEFAKETCYENHLFDDECVELFDEPKEWTTNSNGTKEYEGDKRIKLNEKKFTLSNYFATLTSKYLFGELSKLGCIQTYNAIAKTYDIAPHFRIEELRDLVLKYFEYTPSMLPEEDQDVNLYFIGMTALLEYLAAEIIELSGNASKDHQLEFISTSSIERAVFGDEELERTIFFHLNHLPLVDFNCFYGANQDLLPSIDVNEIVNMGEYNFTQIPTELHYHILKNFSSLEEILEMRLVCKLWNHFIVNDNDIWKNLLCNSMISEDIFRFCDSSFNVDELERILARGRYQKPLTFRQQVINHFYERNDWKSLYFILVRSHLTFLRDLDLMKRRDLFEEYFESNSEDYDKTKQTLQIGITKGLLMDYKFAKHLPAHLSSDVYIPKEAIYDFKLLGKGYYLVGIVDFTKFSSFISCRLFPENGLLYCFHNPKSNQSEFLYYEKYSMESDSLVLFETSDQTFQYATPIYQYQIFNEQIVANQLSSCSLFYLQQLEGQRSSCNLAPCLLFSNNREGEEMEQSYQKDNIILHSEAFDFGKAVSVYISREDFLLRRFNNAKIECCLIDY